MTHDAKGDLIGGAGKGGPCCWCVIDMSMHCDYWERDHNYGWVWGRHSSDDHFTCHLSRDTIYVAVPET